MKKDLEKINMYNTILDDINNHIIKFNNSLVLISKINKTIIYNNQIGGTTQEQGNTSLNEKLDLLNELISIMITNYNKMKDQIKTNNVYLKEIKKQNAINIENISENNTKLDDLNETVGNFK